MLNHHMDLHWMHMADGHTTFRSVREFFGQYSHKSKVLDNGQREIIFEPDEVKVTDWQGWTEVVSIHTVPDKDKVSLGYLDPGQLRDLDCCIDTLVPIYDPTRKFKGFHGEIKHPFEVMTVAKASKRFQNLDDYPHGIFMRVRDGKSDRLQQITRITFHADKSTHYEILTKSGFYNTTNYGVTYYMWGRRDIPVDYCAVCPVTKTKFCAKCRRK